MKLAQTLCLGLLLTGMASVAAMAMDDTTLKIWDGGVEVDVEFDEGSWVGECTDYRVPETCSALAYKATYRMPTTGERAIPFELRLMQDETDENGFKVILRNGFLTDDEGQLDRLDVVAIKGRTTPGRYVFWRGSSECSVMKSNAALPDGGIYCDFSKPLVGLAEGVFSDLQGDGSIQIDGNRFLRVELVGPSGRKTELDFLVPLEGLRGLFAEPNRSSD